MTPPARPGMPVPRGGPGTSRPAPPRPPRPPAANPSAAGAPTPRDGAKGDGPLDPPGSAGSAEEPESTAGRPALDAHGLTPSATSDAVTTYTAGRRALGLPVRPVVVSGASAARFAERVAVRRRLARHRAYVAGAVVGLLGALGWLLFGSPVLALDRAQVEVTGAGTVVDLTDVHAVVAEVDGTPLPRLDTVGLRDRVLEVPGVREAKVSRIWPHGLVVALVSREPVAAVPEGHAATDVPGSDPRDVPRGGFTLLDTEGFPVGWAPEAPEGLPVVSVPVGESHQRTLTAVLTILQALPPELRAEVASIEAATQDTVRMGLRDGKSVVWGSAGDAALKIRVLGALRAAPAAAEAQEYDVSAPTLPITR